MRETDINRFASQFNKEKVMVPTDVAIRDKPKWNVYENNHFAMRKRLNEIFLKVGNKLITRIRAGKRLVKLKARILEEKVQSREDMKRMVSEDWKNAMNSRVGDADELDTNINSVKFKFSFNKAGIHS